MTITQPPTSHRAGRLDLPRGRTPAGVDQADLDQLLEENKQLRALVAKLSEIVLRNVLDRTLPALPPSRAGR
jgi:hypothetical protein